MAIARLNDTGTNFFHASSGSFTDTLSYTPTSGTDTILMVWWGGVGGTLTASALRFNGTSMTNIAGTNWWYLVNPAVTTANIEIDWTSTAQAQIGLYASDYSGAKQTGIPDSANGNQTGGSPSSFSTTVVANNSWVLWGTVFQGNGTTTSSSNWPSLGSQFNIISARNVARGDSNGGLSSGSQSSTFSNSNGGDYDRMDVISLAPVPSLAVANFLEFM